MSTDPSISYTAHLKIEKIKKTDNSRNSGNPPVTRDIVETLNLTIKASTFTRLQEKVAAHVSILEEEDV